MIPREYRDVRVALAWAIVMGGGFVAGVPLFQPEQVGFASDVYYVAARAFLAGENPYLVAAPETGAGFIYPPITLLAFVPHALTGSLLGAYLLQIAINVVTAGAIAWLLLAYLDRQGVALARIDRVLVAGFVLFSVHSTTIYVMGQVNLQLALAVAVGAILVERSVDDHGDRDGDDHRDRDGDDRRDETNSKEALGGAAFATAAAVKLFPAATGAWLLRLRRWRAIAGAVVTGAALTVLGFLLVSEDAFWTFFTETLPSENKAAEFAGGLPPEAMYVTVRRPIAALFPTIDPSLYAVVGVLVLAPFVLLSYRDVGSRVGRLTALLATTLATLLALPFEAFYFSLLYFPLVPLLYLVDAGRVRTLLAAGTVLLSTIISYEPLTVWLGAMPLPAGLETAILDAMRAMLGFAQPPLVGGLLVLVACVLWQHESVTAGRSR